MQGILANLSIGVYFLQFTLSVFSYIVFGKALNVILSKITKCFIILLITSGFLSVQSS